VGASGLDALKSPALEVSGNAHVMGRFIDNNFPKLMPLGGSLASSGIYVAKIGSHGSSLVYATMLAFSGPDADVTALAADASGAVYLTVSTAGGRPVVNAFQSRLTGTINGFAAALNGKTGAFQYLTY
jgi:hypothetical protein